MDRTRSLLAACAKARYPSLSSPAQLTAAMAATSFIRRRCRSSLLLSFSPLIVIFACCGAFPRISSLASPPPDHLPNCSLFPANISSIPPAENHVTYPLDSADYGEAKSLTLFRTLSFDLSASFWTSASFTLTSYNHSQKLAPPSLVFFFLPPSPYSAWWEINAMSYGVVLCFDCHEENSASGPLYFLLDICNASSGLLSIPIRRPAHSCVPSQLEQDIFKDELVLRYSATTGDLSVAAAQHQEKQKITISFNTTAASRRFSVGYITDREATNKLTTHYIRNEHAASSSPSTHHIDVMILVGIIVGTCSLLLAFVIALLALALAIKKRNENRPKAISSSLAASHGAAITLPYRSLHRDSMAGESPGRMMQESPPLITVPPRSNAFQVSAAAAWLKQPTPR